MFTAYYRLAKIWLTHFYLRIVWGKVYFNAGWFDDELS